MSTGVDGDTRTHTMGCLITQHELGSMATRIKRSVFAKYLKLGLVDGKVVLFVQNIGGYEALTQEIIVAVFWTGETIPDEYVNGYIDSIDRGGQYVHVYYRWAN